MFLINVEGTIKIIIIKIMFCIENKGSVFFFNICNEISVNYFKVILM